MAERRQNQLPPEEIAEIKLKEIQFRAEDSEDIQKATLLAMAGIINKKYGQAIRSQEGDQDVASKKPESPVAVPESAAEAALLRYKAQYEDLPQEVQSRCTQEELSSRLNAKDGHYLKLAMNMQDKGKLVFIDKDGNPIFRDGGTEPVMKGMDYHDARRALYGKDYKEGTPHFGYEMPDSVAEIREIEKFTKKPFVVSDNGKEWRSTWMESRKDTSFAREAAFNSVVEIVVDIHSDRMPYDVNPNRGVVRLLRVKKMD